MKRHAKGARYLARALRRMGLFQAWVDLDIPLAGNLDYYTLIYLVGDAAFTLTKEQMQALYGYLKNGGTLLIEPCLATSEETEEKDAMGVADMLASLGVQLNDLNRFHDLLLAPFLFSSAPSGFTDTDKGNLQLGEGVIVSYYDYGCLWQGEQRSGLASREAIRTAMEWGANLVAYALNRQNAKTTKT